MLSFVQPHCCLYTVLSSSHNTESIVALSTIWQFLNNQSSSLIIADTVATQPAIDVFQAAVLIADITGFTPLTERALTSKRGSELVEELTVSMNNYFDEVCLQFFIKSLCPSNCNNAFEVNSCCVYIWIHDQNTAPPLSHLVSTTYWDHINSFRVMFLVVLLSCTWKTLPLCAYKMVLICWLFPNLPHTIGSFLDTKGATAHGGVSPVPCHLFSL